MFVSLPTRQKAALRWATPLLFAALWLAFLWSLGRPDEARRSLWLAWGALGHGLGGGDAWLAALREGGPIVVVDTARRFYPPAASAVGIGLDRLVVVRPPGYREERATVELLAGADAFDAILWPLTYVTRPNATLAARLHQLAGRSQTRILTLLERPAGLDWWGLSSADIRLAVQRNLLRLSPGFFEENSPSEISSRMTADTAQIEQVVGTTISVALRNALMAVGGIGYLLYLAPALTGTICARVARSSPALAPISMPSSAAMKLV